MYKIDTGAIHQDTTPEFISIVFFHQLYIVVFQIRNQISVIDYFCFILKPLLRCYGQISQWVIVLEVKSLWKF